MGNSLKRFAPLVLCLAASIAHADGLGRYAATQDDATMKELISRWAAAGGKSVDWDVAHLISIDSKALNRDANLASARTLQEAVTKVLQGWETHPRYPGSTPDLGAGRPDGPHLYACFFRSGPVALEIHDDIDAPCGKNANSNRKDG